MDVFMRILVSLNTAEHTMALFWRIVNLSLVSTMVVRIVEVRDFLFESLFFYLLIINWIKILYEEPLSKIIMLLQNQN